MGVDRLAALATSERALLPGVSAPRAAQSLAGAVVGHTAMKLTGIKTVTVCPWGIREGVLLRYIEDGGSWWTEMARRSDDAEPAGRAALRPLFPHPPALNSISYMPINSVRSQGDPS